MVLAPRLTDFMAAHPELSLELVSRDNLGDLVAEGFDVAIRLGEPEPSRLTARLLLKTRILTCAAAAYLARRGRPAHPRELADGHHECLLFRDPRTGRPYTWEFHRGRQVLKVNVSGRLVVNDPGTLLSACVAGLGFAQVMDLGRGELLGAGLVNVFPDWSDELFPLSLLYPSRRLPPAKLRAFAEFVQASATSPDHGRELARRLRSGDHPST